MKKLIVFLVAFLFLNPVFPYPKKHYLPFAKKGRYGKLPTKKNKPVKQSYYWTFKQWGR